MKIELADCLNQQQIEAVTYLGAPLLVVAGAGSGKTRVITYRIAQLISQGVNPWNILAVTFTNKAAGEMKTRVEQLLGDQVRVSVGTFHATCMRILRAEVKTLDLEPNFIIYDELNQLTLVKQICKELNLSDRNFHPKEIARKISSAKNKLQSADKFHKQAYHYPDKVIAKVYTIYQQRLLANNAVDFDDIIMYVVGLFRKYPAVLRKYQERWRHILIDEYQDTNHAQYQLVKLLAADGENICVVGDPDQSIYRWRGADVSNILRFVRDYPAVKIVPLEQNYRSTQNILLAANNLIQYNTRRQEKDLWSENSEGDVITVFNGDNEHDEADFVVNVVRDLRQVNSLRYSEMVVFYRTHAQSRVLEQALRYADIPYDIVGGISFYERKEIKDIVAYLVLLVCPQDEVSLRRVINLPARGIGKTALAAIEQVAREKSKSFNQVVWDSVREEELPAKVRDKVKKFARLIDQLRSKMSVHDLPGLIRSLIERIDYISELRKGEKVQAETRIENVQELVSAAEDLAAVHEDAGLSQFLEEVSLLSQVDQWQENDERLTLMTLHCAKGLEFEVVIMVGMEEGLFPHYSSLADLEELEEERRLCYVGMTRAKRKLFMSHVDERMLYGRRSYCTPSKFLDEIPEDLKIHGSCHVSCL